MFSHRPLEEEVQPDHRKNKLRFRNDRSCSLIFLSTTLLLEFESVLVMNFFEAPRNKP